MRQASGRVVAVGLIVWGLGELKACRRFAASLAETADGQPGSCKWGPARRRPGQGKNAKQPGPKPTGQREETRQAEVQENKTGE